MRFFRRTRCARAQRLGFQYQLREITKLPLLRHTAERVAFVEGVWEAYWTTCYRPIQSGFSPGWIRGAR